jgi:hypothetical protein
MTIHRFPLERARPPKLVEGISLEHQCLLDSLNLAVELYALAESCGFTETARGLWSLVCERYDAVLAVRRVKP